MADQTDKHDESSNGLESPSKSEERTEDFKFLIDYGLDTKVAARLDDIYKTGSNLRFPNVRTWELKNRFMTHS